MPSSGQITAGELARVCAHYELGDVHSARKLKRGAKASPKVVLETSRGGFFLKRRAPGREAPATVAIAHEVQLFLNSKGFPTPRLLGTKRDNNSMLQLDGRVYEVFEFVRGVSFDRSVAHSESAGRTLARLHVLLREVKPSWTPPEGAYHAAAGVPERLSAIAQRTEDMQVRRLARELRLLYLLAAQEAEAQASGWRPNQLIHADWHPGNMIFSGDGTGDVVGVLDFDSVRVAPPVTDLANAALQFSIVRNASAKHERDTNELSLIRLAAVCRGYHSGYRQPLPRAEIQALPWLMVEALITETAVTVAATGRFGPVEAGEIMSMVWRKGQWLRDRASDISALVM